MTGSRRQIKTGIVDFNSEFLAHLVVAVAGVVVVDLVSVGSDTIAAMPRFRTIIGCRSDAEILTDFARMLAFKTMLDDLHATSTGDDTTDTAGGSGSLAADYAPDGEGPAWRRKSSS